MRIAVASVTLGSGFPALVYGHLKRQLRTGETIDEVQTITQTDPAFSRARMLSLLDHDPKPVALIGICIRPEEGVMAAYRAAGVPVILIDEEVEGATTIASDNFSGGYLAGQHLASSGRRSIAVVSGQTGITGGYNALLRVKGFAKAMAEHRLRFAMEDVIEVVTYSHKDGVNAMATILRRSQRADAVFCAAGDAAATGLLAAARERQIKVPDQLAILGYDDLPLAGISDPPLSTIRQPLERIAREAHRLATEETAEVLARPKRVLFDPTLVRRATA